MSLSSWLLNLLALLDFLGSPLDFTVLRMSAVDCFLWVLRVVSRVVSRMVSRELMVGSSKGYLGLLGVAR